MATSAGLILNEDSSHFFTSRSAREMTREDLLAFIDQYAGTQGTHLFLNPNSQRTSYRSQVWDPIWEHGKQNPPEDDGGKRWCANARRLDEQGLDPYAIWTARAYEKGISPWISMRMNDVHDVGDYTVAGQSRRLQPGMVVTVEPGLYIRPSSKAPKHLHNIGIRLEDDVVVTKTGHTMITSGAPRSADDIEAWMAGA